MNRARRPFFGMPSRFDKPLAIVPAYNEQAAVGGVVGEICRACPDFDVLVIDDGSTDSTADEAPAARPQVVHAPVNLGIGRATERGEPEPVRGGLLLPLHDDSDR